MLLGHYGVALGAKRIAPRASLGTLAFAAQFLDELWPILVLAGVEHVRVVPGSMAANPLEFTYYPYSHSLLFALIWGTIIAGLHYWRVGDRRTATIIGVVVISHWILDLPMHRPDLPLIPGSDVKVGLGAWASIPLTIVIELAVFGGGLFSYLRTTRSRDRVGSWGLAIATLLLLAIFFGGFRSAPPASERAVASGAMGLWLFALLFWWIDRHRERKTA